MRVDIIEGNIPALIVAPHGCEKDDANTDLIAEHIATSIDAYAVINRGWEKSDRVDCFKDKANCNNVKHCHEDVVKDEFLLPIMRYIVQILRFSPYAYIFYIHGITNDIKKQFPDLQIILGCGRGKIQSSESCDDCRKDAFVTFLNNKNVKAYEGVDGKYAGKDKNNLNQLYRQWYPNSSVHSMQLEIVRSNRTPKGIAKMMATNISRAMSDLVAISDNGFSRIIIAP